MFEGLFLSINAWMNGGQGLAALGCLLWGLVSVLFSPCHLASIPLVVGYVAGQDGAVKGGLAVKYAALFSLGLFLSIAAAGLVCSLLGRFLGDIGSYGSLPLGALLILASLDMLGLTGFPLSRRLTGGLKVKGASGALILGLSYGLLSGGCTFGFLAPALAVAAAQPSLARAGVFVGLFALGHCLPILAAGSSAGLTKRWLETSLLRKGAFWVRRAAGALVGAGGLYFILRPFI